MKSRITNYTLTSTIKALVSILINSHKLYLRKTIHYKFNVCGKAKLDSLLNFDIILVHAFKIFRNTYFYILIRILILLILMYFNT